MLRGTRLLDPSSRLPGPLCSLILSDCEAKDGGFLALEALEKNSWRAFCDAVARPDWFERYEDEDSMRDETFINEVRDLFLTRTRREWLALFEDHDICLSPVYFLEEVERDPHVTARGIFRWVSLEEGRCYPRIRFPIQREEVSAWEQEAPEPGRHNRDLLGLSELELEELKREGVV